MMKESFLPVEDEIRSETEIEPINKLTDRGCLLFQLADSE
jgi:hypothetical protein